MKNKEDSPTSTFLIMVTVFLFGMIIGTVIDTRLTRCWQAALHNAPVVWEEYTPFCKVRIEVDGNSKLLTVKDYKKIMDIKEW